MLPAQKTVRMGETVENFLLSISYFWIFFFKEWTCFSLSLQGNEGWGIPILDTKAESLLLIRASRTLSRSLPRAP